MKKILLTLAMVVSVVLSSPVVAHNPAPDININKVVPISAWCSDANDAVRLVKHMHREDMDAILKMYMSTDPDVGGSSCHNVFVMREMIRQMLPMPSVALEDVHLDVYAPDGKITSIVQVTNSSGNTVYTWHTWEPNEP